MQYLEKCNINLGQAAQEKKPSLPQYTLSVTLWIVTFVSRVQVFCKLDLTIPWDHAIQTHHQNGSESRPDPADKVPAFK